MRIVTDAGLTRAREATAVAYVDLYWLPLGAGGHSVRLNGRVFERIVAQLAKQLAERKKQTGQPVRGLISVCAAGGQGVTAILEA